MKNIQILLVEDNEGDILLTLDAFEESKLKANINVVRNGRYALKYLRKEDPFQSVADIDLILLDINIPFYNGHQVLVEIKNEIRLKKIPVIMLTTSSNPKDVQKAYDNYANCYIVKPIEMDEFLKAILKIEEFWLQLCTLAE